MHHNVQLSHLIIICMHINHVIIFTFWCCKFGMTVGCWSCFQGLGWSWKDCSSASALVNIKSLSISPDPLAFPGPLVVSAEFTSKADITSPVKVRQCLFYYFKIYYYNLSVFSPGFQHFTTNIWVLSHLRTV